MSEAETMTPDETETRDREDLTDAQLLDIVTDPVSTGDYHAAREALLGRLEGADTALEEAEARVEELEGALEPFAGARFGHYEKSPRVWEHFNPAQFTAARRALDREE